MDAFRKWLFGDFATKLEKAFEREVAFYKQAAEEAKTRADTLERKLFAEIAANRKREEAFALAAVKKDAPRVLPKRADEPKEADEPERQPNLYYADEAAVKQIAAQFVEEAERNGKPYTDEAYEVLCEMIRNNPQEYGL